MRRTDPALPPVILMGGLIAGIGTPTEVSTFAVLYGLGLGLFYRELNWRNLWDILTETSNLTGMIFFTVSAAMVFSWALTLEGLPTAIATFVGSPDEVIEKVLFQHELFRHDRFLVQFSVGTLPHAAVMRSIELFGTKVAPAVRKAVAASGATPGHA